MTSHVEMPMPTMDVTVDPGTTHPTMVTSEMPMPTMDVTVEPVTSTDVCTQEESVESEVECLRAYILSLAGDISHLRQRVEETELEVDQLSSCCDTDQCSDVYSQIE